MTETSLREGQRIAGFRVERRLGRGGMGEVYLALELDTSALRALKVVPSEYIVASDARDRLLREARLAQGLEHPNIVKIFGLDSADGLDFIVMEYVEGETLEERLRRGPLDVGAAYSMGVDVAGALATAHAVGLVHRDIKPSNLMFDMLGRVKVLDFGLAKRFIATEEGDSGDGGTLSRLTRTGAIVGTVAYMSPEQSRGEPLDGRSDLFSLGGVMYEAVTGRRPFQGESALEVMHEIATVDPLPVGLIRPELPRKLDELLSRALAKDPRKRFQSATEIGSVLGELRDAEQVSRPRAQTARTGATCRLPASPTSFIGRTRERAEVRSILANQRMLTITGAGGSGKTRLATQVASDLAEALPDGVWFVDFSPVQDPELVGPSIGAALGVRERPGDDPLQSVLAFLEARSLLLVLDNCEHLKAACAAWIGAVLRRTCRIRILATSREPLGIEGEHTWVIPPLTTLSVREASSARPESLLQSEAVRLFVERAKAASPAFALNAENAPLIADICLQLDGLPLAIELCAARVRVLPLQEIRRRLGDSFRLLTAGDESLPPRQRTLRATVDWSYDLLTGSEQALFRSLSVFTGGGSLDAVESVCSDVATPPDQVVDLISSLSGKSLLVSGESAGGVPRYRLLETLRQYARDRLREHGEETQLQERLCDYYESLAEEAEPALEGPEQVLWLERLDEEHGNLRTAMDWLAKRGLTERSLRIAGSIGRFWWVRGHWREGLRRLEPMLSTGSNSASAAVLAKALGGAGRLFLERGDYNTALLRLEESLRLYRELGDTHGAAMALVNIGITVQSKGDFDRARACYEESLELQQHIGNLRGVAIVYNLLGRLAYDLGDAASSLHYFGQGLDLRRRLGDSRGVAISLVGMGHAALRQGDSTAARSYLLQGLAIHRELGDPQGSAYALGSLGLTALSSGDLVASRAYLMEALTIEQELGDTLAQAETLDSLAELAFRTERPEHALRILGAASAIYEALGSPRNARDTERISAWKNDAEATIGPGSAAIEFAAGQAMGPEQAVALALETVRDLPRPSVCG